MRNGALCSLLLLWSLTAHCDEAATQYFDAFPYYVEPHEDRGDADQDGVVDSMDDCPNTLPRAAVDGSGCMRGVQTITLQGVNFEYASAVLTEHARRTLEGVARALSEQPDVLVEIAGHTDARGSDTYNLNLSRSRAESVRDYLVRPGVDNARLRASGYGESQPVASNDSDAGRALNRRVELRVRAND